MVDLAFAAVTALMVEFAFAAVPTLEGNSTFAAVPAHCGHSDDAGPACVQPYFYIELLCLPLFAFFGKKM